ncbi:MAG: DUF4249 domain-containing protein [Bacteroidia bacterium]|nr:DUF4249 domain-containing protein [Bacteroidia bacterium]
MKRYIYTAFTFITAAFALSSCEDPIDLDLGVPVEQLVIDAVINQTTDTQYIRITKSISFLDNGNYTGVQVDTVGIVDTSNNAFHVFNYKGDGWYYFVPLPNTFEIGKTYQLLIRDGANTYFSESKLNAPTVIDSFTNSYEDPGKFGGPKGNYVTLWAKDKPGVGDFYWFKLYRNDSLQMKASDITIAAENTFTSDGEGDGDGDLFIVPIRESFTKRPYKSGETARIEILSITPEMFIYLNLVTTQLNNQGLFAVPPSNIPSNIICFNNPNKKLLGFFGMVGIVSTDKKLIQ